MTFIRWTQNFNPYKYNKFFKNLSLSVPRTRTSFSNISSKGLINHLYGKDGENPLGTASLAVHNYDDQAATCANIVFDWFLEPSKFTEK